MAEPGDPNEPNDPLAPPRRAPEPTDFDDDLVGFTSADHIAGRPVVEDPKPDPASPEPVPQPPEPELFTAEPSLDPDPQPDFLRPEPTPAPAYVAPEPRPTPAPAAERAPFGRAPARDSVEIERSMPTYAIYVLILCAVPTLGVAAVIGLLALGSRSAAANPVLQTHYIYQARTLWAGALAGVGGVILLPVGIGLFVIFSTAIWLLARGAWGVFLLKAGRAVPRPRSWLF